MTSKQLLYLSGFLHGCVMCAIILYFTGCTKPAQLQPLTIDKCYTCTISKTIGADSSGRESYSVTSEDTAICGVSAEYVQAYETERTRKEVYSTETTYTVITYETVCK